jgi:hypothetical protein
MTRASIRLTIVFDETPQGGSQNAGATSGPQTELGLEASSAAGSTRTRLLAVFAARIAALGIAIDLESAEPRARPTT